MKSVNSVGLKMRGSDGDVAGNWCDAVSLGQWLLKLVTFIFRAQQCDFFGCLTLGSQGSAILRNGRNHSHIDTVSHATGPES